jgi:hypothetical protein
MSTKPLHPRRFHIGIDIGKEGSIVIQDHKEGKIETHRMPKVGKEIDYQGLYNLLEPYEAGNGILVFEKVVPYGVKSAMFSLGYQSGALEMACIALCIPYVKVPPQTWQKEMFTGVEEMKKSSSTTKSGQSRDTKSMAKIAAMRLFPTVRLTYGDRATKPHDGLIDALLMSEYAKRKYP